MEFTSFIPFFLLLFLIPLLYFLKTSLVERPPVKKYISFTCRILAYICIILALCQPYASRTSKDRHVIYLLDVSESADLTDVLSRLNDIEKSISTLGSLDT